MPICHWEESNGVFFLLTVLVPGCVSQYYAAITKDVSEICSYTANHSQKLGPQIHTNLLFLIILCIDLAVHNQSPLYSCSQQENGLRVEFNCDIGMAGPLSVCGLTVSGQKDDFGLFFLHSI